MSLIEEKLAVAATLLILENIVEKKLQKEMNKMV